MGKPHSKKIQFSITKLYYCFTLLIIFVTFAIAFWISTEQYYKHLVQKRLTFESEGTQIAYRFSEKLGVTEYVISYFVNTIQDSNDFSYDNINWLISDKVEDYKYDVIAWTFLNYVNENLHLKALSHVDNIIATNIDYGESRPNIVNADSKNEKLIFGKRSIGLISKSKVLPIAMKMHDKDNNFKGYISAGLDLDKLNQTLDDVTPCSISYILLDKEFDYITSSMHLSRSQMHILQKKLHQFAQYGIDQQYIQNPLKFQQNVYHYLRKMDNYPFYILVGEEGNFYYEKYKSYIIPEIFRNILVGVIFATALIFLSYSVVKPVLELSEDAAAISEGNSIKKGRFYNAEEFNLLYRQLSNIEDMASKLVQKELEAKEVNNKLKIANSMIRSNISFMTHELKNPNYSIIGFSDLVKKDNLDDASKDALQMIKEAAEYQSGQIQYFLDLFSFQSSGRSMKKAFIDLSYLIHWNIAMLKNMADERHILIEKRLSKNLPYFLCDGIMFGQMLQNLLSNSIKYNNENGKITIIAEVVEKGRNACPHLRITIEDDGIGISPKNQRKIFSKFKRSDEHSDSSTNSNSKVIGHGIGLAYVKKCVLEHEGTITIQSALGKGAKFILEFPFC